MKKELFSVDKFKKLETGFDKIQKSLISEAFLLLDFTRNNI